MTHLEPMPRHAKRLLNRLRLLLFIAHERKMFGGQPALSPRHIGKWAVLCERWPDLAIVVSSDVLVMRALEDSKQYAATVALQAPAHRADAALYEFCLQGSVKLAPVLQRIVEFSPAAIRKAA